MDPERPSPGLRLRVAIERRRISSQHRQLDGLYDIAATALTEQPIAAAYAAFQRFRDAWEAHTGLEDGFYFPALLGLRRSVGPQLEALSAEHGRFHAELDAIEPLYAAGDANGAAAALEAFVERITEHERREEALARELSAATEP
jgi:hypothetical protein